MNVEQNHINITCKNNDCSKNDSFTWSEYNVATIRYVTIYIKVSCYCSQRNILVVGLILHHAIYPLNQPTFDYFSTNWVKRLMRLLDIYDVIVVIRRDVTGN